MTYSIVARDPETGNLGVAVQSQAFWGREGSASRPISRVLSSTAWQTRDGHPSGTPVTRRLERPT
jgi:hypothetical protein